MSNTKLLVAFFFVAPDLRHVVLLIACLLIPTNVQGQEPAVYKLNGELPAMRLSFPDLEKFLKDLDQLRSSKSAENIPPCSYEITGPKGSVAGTSVDRIMNQERLGPYATEFYLSCPGSPQSISLTLNDFPTWTISGTDWLQLNSLRNLIEQFGRDYKTYFGGVLFQFGMSVVVGCLYWFGVPTVLTPHLPRWRDSAVLYWLFFVVGIVFLGALALYGVPKYLFPTIAIYRGTPNILERYASEISFLGVVLPIFLMLPFRRWWERMSSLQSNSGR